MTRRQRLRRRRRALAHTAAGIRGRLVPSEPWRESFLPPHLRPPRWVLSHQVHAAASSGERVMPWTHGLPVTAWRDGESVDGAA